MNEEACITIPLEEYKELLVIKGKYEELKQYYMPHIYPTRISYDGKPIGGLEYPYKVTCGTYNTCADDYNDDEVQIG